MPRRRQRQRTHNVAFIARLCYYFFAFIQLFLGNGVKRERERERSVDEGYEQSKIKIKKENRVLLCSSSFSSKPIPLTGSNVERNWTAKCKTFACDEACEKSRERKRENATKIESMRRNMCAAQFRFVCQNIYTKFNKERRRIEVKPRTMDGRTPVATVDLRDQQNMQCMQ